MSVTKKFFPFNAGAGAGVRMAEWSKMFRQVFSSGPVKSYLNGLEVYADSTGMQIKVKSGGALLVGHYYENTAEEILAVTAAHASLARYDRVVLEVDWTKSDDQIAVQVITGTPAASPTVPVLTQSDSLWQISLAKITVAAGVTTIAAGAVTDMREMVTPSGSSKSMTSFSCVNNSGSLITAGMVVVFDASVTKGCKTTTRERDPSVIGVVGGNILAGDAGEVENSGVHDVLVTGNVTNGHWLVTSTTAGYAKDSGSTQRPNIGAIGLATSSFTGSTGSVSCLLSVDPYTSNTVLQKLPTVTIASGLTFGHTVDSGTDLLVLLVLGQSSGNNKPTAASWGATGMTLIQSDDETSNYKSAAAFFLRNPAQGAGTFTISLYSASLIYAVALNYVGSQASPIRSSVISKLSLSQSVSSVTGDIVLGVIGNNSALTPANGQTVLTSQGYDPRWYFAELAALAGATTEGWTGTQNSAIHLSLALAGS